MSKLRYGFCPKCGKLCHLTDHHVLPRRFFGRNDSKIKLCRACHDLIEVVIPLYRKLSKTEYLRITQLWLLGREPKVY